MAWICSTRFSGPSASVSRVPGPAAADVDARGGTAGYEDDRRTGLPPPPGALMVADTDAGDVGDRAERRRSRLIGPRLGVGASESSTVPGVLDRPEMPNTLRRRAARAVSNGRPPKSSSRGGRWRSNSARSARDTRRGRRFGAFGDAASSASRPTRCSTSSTSTSARERCSDRRSTLSAGMVPGPVDGVAIR